MRISLLSCPFTDPHTPSLQSALLSALLKNRGYSVYSADFNRYMYLKSAKKYGMMWELTNQWQEDNPWTGSCFLPLFIKNNSSHIDRFAGAVAARKPSLACFTVYRKNCALSVETAARIRAKDAGIAMVFIALDPMENTGMKNILENRHADFIITDNAEETLVELARRFRAGSDISGCKGLFLRDGTRMRFTGKRKPPLDINSLPYPDFRDSSGTRDHLEVVPVQASRGCIKSCAFCTDTQRWKPFLGMNAKRIYSELVHQRRRYHAGRFVFFDSCLAGDTDTISSLCGMIIDSKELSGIRWGAVWTVLPGIPRSFFEKMKKAGCEYLCFGLDTGSRRILKKMGSSITIKQNEKTLRDIHNSGILTAPSFFIGFPGETEADFRKTLDFVEKNIEYIDHPLEYLFQTPVLNPSRLYRNRSGYGISSGSAEPVFWRTSSGKNDYFVRQERYWRFIGKVLRWKRGYIPEIDLNIQRAARLYHLAEYWERAGRGNTASYYYGRLLGERLVPEPFKDIIRNRIGSRRVRCRTGKNS
ncbi:MAG: radical SAM protein [Elusimicrobia bacterium]|nr:radical SAM protein [Elusimicrobiota bacterium]